MGLFKIRIEQCQAANGIEDEFGSVAAMKYLVGEKLMNDLQAAETKTIFEPWQLAEYLTRAEWTEPFDPSIHEDEDPKVIEKERNDKDDGPRQNPDRIT